jgi:hypothetical protein
VSVDWDGYELYDPGVSAPLCDVPRAEARRAYERCMQTKSARIEGLRTLLEANGVVLGDDDGSVQALNDWYVAEIEPEPEMPPGWLRPEWYTVSHDVALFLSDLIIARHPNLRWEFYTWGKRCIDYQQHVIKRNDGPPIGRKEWMEAILAPMPDRPPRRLRKASAPADSENSNQRRSDHSR